MDSIAMPATSAAVPVHVGYGAGPARAHAAAAISAQPVGTFAPHTKVQVGGHRVVVERYLSEGGFAHVYVVRLPKPVDGSDVAVLKRVAVPDKETLAHMRNEVETMKRLKGHRHIVTYFDSHASALKGGGYEVFLLMEFCAGGGLIDFMNTRLQKRLTEPEILHIFSDVAEGVACMHYLQPALLHRDLKVENVLISTRGSSRRYKLCDFGSAAPPKPPATTSTECQLLEDDIQKHTTLQYRSPEMVDIYRRLPIDEKSDIWALGVLLYKLCYYTTPFEEKGQLAILNASFSFPGYPQFSDRLKRLIAWTLRENPHARPNIYEVIQETCLMRGTEIPIKDIYSGRSRSGSRQTGHLSPPALPVQSPPNVGAFYVQPTQQKQQPLAGIDVVPMRRGRPQAPAPQPVNSKPSVSSLRGTKGDPFAALDNPSAGSAATPPQDELSERFPSIEEFSILQKPGADVGSAQTSRPGTAKTPDLSQRVTEKLADDAFARPAPLAATATQKPHGPAAAGISREPPSRQASEGASSGHQRPSPMSQPLPPRSARVSQDSVTSPPPPHEVKAATRSRESSHGGSFGRSVDDGPATSDFNLRPAASDTFVSRKTRPASQLLPRPVSMHRSKSHTSTSFQMVESPRASLDITRTPSLGNRPSSASNRNGRRPASVYLESSLAYRNDGSTAHEQIAGVPDAPVLRGRASLTTDRGSTDAAGGEATIQSNVGFLKAMEEADGTRRREKRRSVESKHSKRSSLPSISLSSTKTLLAGRFGDAFRRFEANGTSAAKQDREAFQSHRPRDLSPITMSERTGDRSDDDHAAETDEISPEVRRELERRALAQEERRVEAAAEEHRRRVADRAGPGNGDILASADARSRIKATTIQESVKSSLDENSRPEAAQSAENVVGAEHHDTATLARVPSESRTQSIPPEPTTSLPSSIPGRSAHQLHQPKASRTFPIGHDVDTAVHPASQTAPAASVARRPVSRPSAPPKPEKLRTGGAAPPEAGRAGLVGGPKPADDAVTTSSTTTAPPAAAAGNTPIEIWEANFSRRYPSLSQLEMVETEIDRPPATALRSKES